MTYLFETADLRDLAPEVIDQDGLPRIMSARFYARTSAPERAWLAQRFGLYCLPTIELCKWLTRFIGLRSAIEIGAGNGRMAQRLGITATDSFLQDDPKVQWYYEAMGQPAAKYGPNVERLEASEAVRKYRPSVVVGSWITHRYNPERHDLGGNMYGPDIDSILEQVDHYVLIGNTGVHAQNPLWSRPHDVSYFPWLYSRALNGQPDFIAVWRGRQ